jgi:hypothetical protein
MGTVYESLQYVVSQDVSLRIVVVRRMAAVFASIADVKEAHQGIEKAMGRIDRPTYRLVWDLRAGPLRNDPVFESVTTVYRRSIMRGFARKLVLVATALGKLQVQRHAADDRLDVEVFDSVEAIQQALGQCGKLRL